MLIDRDFVLRIVQVACAIFGLATLNPIFYNISTSVNCFFIAVIIQLVIVILDAHDEGKYYEDENNWKDNDDDNYDK